MIYPIVKFGDPVLEKPAAPVTAFDEELKKLVADMFESMYEAHGVGLAAPQIGISKRLAVIDISFKEDPEARLVLANPEIIHTEGEQTGQEGCLSVGKVPAVVTRPMKARLKAQNEKGEWFEQDAEGYAARCFLHETDHCDGKLFIDHLPKLRRDMVVKRFKKERNWT